MARRKTTRRPRSTARSSAPPKLSTLLVLLAILGGIWLYQNGYLDSFLGTIPGVESPAAEAPEQQDGTEAEPPAAPQPTVAQPPAPSVAAAAPEQSVETDALRGYSGAWYQVYFTKPAYPETAADRVGGLDETIAADIDRATQGVDIAVYDFDLPRVAEALIRAAQRGIAVRVAVDGENLADADMAKLMGDIETAGIPLFKDEREAFMHNKFLVLDSSVVWTGSANMTVNDVYRNNNNMLRIVAPELAANYTAKMDDLMAGTGGTAGDSVLVHPELTIGGATVDTFFAPDDATTSAIVDRINAAQQRVDVLAFAFTSDPIANAMVAARSRGLPVRGVMESRNSKGSGSEFAALQAGGIDMHTDGNCYVLHSKTIIIDGHIVITGSFNWTASAEKQNDENFLIVDDASLAARYLEEFDRIYQQALAPTRCG